MMDLINRVIDWASIADPARVKEWEGYEKEYLKEWGWNNRAISDFHSWGKDGFNNKLLHEKNSVEQFYDEVEYCSDRMSLDRLFRCHVMYRNMKR